MNKLKKHILEETDKAGLKYLESQRKYLLTGNTAIPVDHDYAYWRALFDLTLWIEKMEESNHERG